MDLGDSFNALYSQFLLRDVTAKSVPGGVILLGGSLPFLRKPDDLQPLLEIGLVFGVALFASCWTLGFAVQGIGFMCRVLRNYPRGNTGEDYRGLQQELRGKMATLSSHARFRQEQAVERFVVIKEATGNLAVALAILALQVLSLLLLGLVPFAFDARVVATLVLLVGVAVALIFIHRRAVNWEWDERKSVLGINTDESVRDWLKMRRSNAAQQ